MKTFISACACLLAAVALSGCGSDDESDTTTAATTETTATETTTTEPTTTTTPPEQSTVVRITVVNGAPEGGIVRKTVSRGDRVVVVVVSSDVADEIHLHGYNKSRDVEAGGTVRIPFEATIPGRFEVELESRGVQIADISVEP